MLRFLGSTLSQGAINNFFTLSNVSPQQEDLPFEQVIIFLEDEVHRSTEQAKSVGPDRQVPDMGGPTPRPSDSPKEDTRILAPLAVTDVPDPASGPHDDAAILGETMLSVLAFNADQGHNKPFQPPEKPEAMRSVTNQTFQAGDITAAASNRQSAVPPGPLPAALFPATGLPNQDMHKEDRGSGSSSNRVVEHLINIHHCPVCGRLRTKPEEAEDIVTHLAVCPSSDWEVLSYALREKNVGLRMRRKGSALRHSIPANRADTAHAATDAPVM